MAALQCEICGGKLIGKAGGIFECDSCGMQYDKTWVKEKVQEIKGTVKVEGTVEVQGTVKVEGSANKEALLTRGQLALKEGEFASAQSFFDQVLNADAKCSEAYFGIALTKAKCPDMEAFAQQGIGAASAASCKAAVRDLSAEENLIRKYERPPFLTAESLKRQLAFDFAYTSRVQSLEENWKNAVEFLESSKELRYAGEYGAAEMQQRLQNWMAAVNAAYEAAIAEEKQRDLESVQDVQVRYRQWLLQKETAFSEQKGQNQAWDHVYEDRDLLDFLQHLLSACRSAEVSVAQDGSGFSTKKTRKQYSAPEWTDLVSYCEGYRFGSYGDSYYVGLRSDGTVMVEGKGMDPGEIPSWTDIVAVATGNRVVAGLKSDGTVITNCGKDLAGFENVTAIKVHDHGGIVGLRADGTLALCGWQHGTDAWNRVVAIAECGNDILGLRSDGTVLTTAVNLDYRCREEISGWDHIVAVAGSRACVAGLKSDGTLVAATAEKTPKPDVSPWRNVVAVDVVGSTITALTGDGRLLSTNPAAEKAPIFRSLSDLNPLLKDRFLWKEKLKENIAARNAKWKCIYSDRELMDIMQSMMCTYSFKYHPPYGSNPYHVTLSINADGTVDSGSTRRSFEGWTDIVDLAEWSGSVVGVKKDGGVVACGEFFKDVPRMAGWNKIVQVVTGNINGPFVAGLRTDGTIVAMDSAKGAFDRWSDIVSFTRYTGLKADGTMVIAGEHHKDVTKWKNIVAFSDNRSIVGLRSDGTVVVSGANKDGECDVSSWRDIVAVASGGLYHTYTVGLKADGSVVGTKEAVLPDTSPECFVLAIGDDGEYWMSNGRCIKFAPNSAKVKSCREMPFDSPDSLLPLAEKRRAEKNRLAQKIKVKAKNQYDGAVQRMAVLASEIAALETELANLKGLFAGLRRGGLEEQLSAKRGEYSKQEMRCKALEEQL